ncbi:hypothetical protein D3C79_914190 [compost metagenome]
MDCMTAIPHKTRANPDTARLMNCSGSDIFRHSATARDVCGNSPAITAAAHRLSEAASNGEAMELI